jgi:predicted RNase H-like HicB family nuclease
MTNEFIAIVEEGDDGWWLARSPEVPVANGQGRTAAEAVEGLAAAIEFVLVCAREEAQETMPAGAIKVWCASAGRTVGIHRCPRRLPLLLP